MFLIGSAIVATKSSHIFNIYKLPVRGGVNTCIYYKNTLMLSFYLLCKVKQKMEIVPVVFVSPALKTAMGFSEVITFNT